MPNDAFTINRIAAELNGVLSGAKIEKIVQPSPDMIILYVYTKRDGNKRLVLSANPVFYRVAFTERKYENPTVAPNFCMLARKHLLSAVVQSAETFGYERVIKIVLTAKNDFYEQCEKTLYCELMGKYSNIILTENGKVLGCLKTSYVEDMTKRVLVSSAPYAPPPSQAKISPDKDLSALLASYEDDEFEAQSGGDANAENCAKPDETLSAFLFRNVKGLALSTAGEIVAAKYGGNCPRRFDAIEAQEFSAFINAFVTSPPLNPCAEFSKDGKPVDFYLFPYSSAKGEIQSYASVLEAAEKFYSVKEKERELSNFKSRLERAARGALKKAEKKLSLIVARRNDCADADINRLKGELLIANIYRIPPRSELIELENYNCENGEKVQIKLDGRLSVSKNAEAYYNRYNKQKRALAVTEKQKEEAEKEITYLESVLAEIQLAESAADCGFVEEELKETGYIRAPRANCRKKDSAAKKFREYAIDGFAVFVGRNNVENDELTSSARPRDLWLHAKDYHSAHIIIRTEGKTVPKSTLLVCAEICAYYSRGRNGSKIQIDATEKRNVKKIPSAPKGAFVYTGSEGIVADPKKHEEYLKTNI